MGKDAITFGDIEVKNRKFHRYKNPFFKWCKYWQHISICKISSGEKSYKYFIGYLDKNKNKPFSIILPKMNTYVKGYDGKTKWMYFLTWV